ncbi:unnamed protein product [Miscanthus lutarioriparius]|uniref:C3H1-type domain-containing protein n=1 Tax=Miscanthus lutarioriparius TaxID=422564 RepID=A0A811PQY1_9POAL|nr:unnamed protein product [Miscanthus lutarioriparius]
MDSAARPDEEEARRRRSTDCIYFLASPLTCKKGSECEYRHSDAARMNPRDCWYWFHGNCANPKCSFRHPPLDNLAGAPTTPRPAQQSVPQASASVPAQPHGSVPAIAKQGVPCYYFQKGMCTKGDRARLRVGVIDKPKASAHDGKLLHHKQSPTMSRADHRSRVYQNHSNSYAQPGAPKCYQPRPSVQDGLTDNGMEVGEFVREPSAGSGVIVGAADDDANSHSRETIPLTTIVLMDQLKPLVSMTLILRMSAMTNIVGKRLGPRSEEWDRGSRVRLSPPKPSDLRGRLHERLKARSAEEIPGNSAKDLAVKENSSEDTESLNFAGPKSLAELKAKKDVGRSGEDAIVKGLGSSRVTSEIVSSREAAPFEGPKPLSAILKRKREATSEIPAAQPGIIQEADNYTAGAEEEFQTVANDTVGENMEALEKKRRKRKPSILKMIAQELDEYQDAEAAAEDNTDEAAAAQELDEYQDAEAAAEDYDDEAAAAQELEEHQDGEAAAEDYDYEAVDANAEEENDYQEYQDDATI